MHQYYAIIKDEEKTFEAVIEETRSLHEDMLEEFSTKNLIHVEENESECEEEFLEKYIGIEDMEKIQSNFELYGELNFLEKRIESQKLHI